MKRPTFALLSLLALLAFGLVAVGPKCCEAGSLGELAFAIAVERTDAGDPIVCPRVCRPLSEELEGDEETTEAPASNEGEIELNAAETNDVETELADDESGNIDYDTYYGDYGLEYGDEYDPYCEEVSAGEEVDVASAPPAADDMELNAAQTHNDDLHADGCFGQYSPEYSYQYTEHGCDYGWIPEEAAAEVSDECHGLGNDSPERICIVGVRSQIRDSDLVIEEAAETVDPFDAYGRQVGDDYTSGDDAVEDDYTSDYDAIYDEAVYGDARAASDSWRYDVATPPMVAEDDMSIEEAYLAGRCIDEQCALVIDDLPWADEPGIAAMESAGADVSELDVPSMPVAEPACGKASEYGSDYAEEYYEEYFESLEQELLPLEKAKTWPMPESADCREHLGVAAALFALGDIDLLEIVSYLGRQVSNLADSLNTLGSVVRTACAEMGPITRSR